MHPIHFFQDRTCLLLTRTKRVFPQISAEKHSCKDKSQLTKMPKQLAMPIWLLNLLFAVVLAQQQCYYGPGAQNRGSSDLVPCNSTGSSACCLQGDTCLSGNACYNFETGNVYQYGCTDIDYNDETCPYKCGFDPGTRISSPQCLHTKLMLASQIAMDSIGILQRCARPLQYMGLPRPGKLRLRMGRDRVTPGSSAEGV